jgi:hypothetical protein
MMTQITGHFILYEVFQVSTGKTIGELVVARDELYYEKALKRELKNIAKAMIIRYQIFNEAGRQILDMARTGNFTDIVA